MSDIDLLMQEFLPSKEKLLAEKLRRNQQAQALSGATDQAHSMDLGNFVAGVSNNPDLAKSMNTYTENTQKRYKPVQMGQSGFMLPGSGEYTESPMYVDQKEQDRQQKILSVLTLSQAAKERAAAHDQTLLGIAAGNNQARLLAAAIAASSRNNAAAKPAKPLPSAQAKAWTENNVAMNKIDETLAAFEKDPNAVGKKGFLPDVLLQRLDPKGVLGRAKIADVGSLKIHDRSGAAVTAAEFPRLQPFIPSARDTPDTVRTKLQNFRREYELIQDEIKNYAEDMGYIVPKTRTGEAPAGAATKGAKKAVKDMSDDELDAYEKSLKGQ